MSLVIAANAWNFDEFGGADKIATELAIFCAENGWRVNYICAGGVRKTEKSREHGVEVWRYPRPGSAIGMKSAWNFCGHVMEICRILRQVRAADDPGRSWVLNGHTALQQAGMIVGSLAWPRKRIVSSVHSPMVEEYLASLTDRRKNWRQKLTIALMRRIESFCYRRSNAIQCFSNYTSSLLERDFRSGVVGRLTVTAGYVDCREFSALKAPRLEARKRLAGTYWKTEDTIFFCLRRLTERMGIDNLIRACGILREITGRTDFRLIIGGEGHLRRELERQSRKLNLTDNVYFAGRIPENDVAWAYRAADCFVLPTRALECFGLVILEAFAAGTPVRATPVGAIPEVLGAFATSSLMKGNDPAAIAEGLKNFLMKSGPLESESELRAYAEKFDKNEALDRLVNVLTGKK